MGDRIRDWLQRLASEAAYSGMAQLRDDLREVLRRLDEHHTMSRRARRWEAAARRLFAAQEVCSGCGVARGKHEEYGGEPMYRRDCGDHEEPDRCGYWVKPSELIPQMRERCCAELQALRDEIARREDEHKSDLSAARRELGEVRAALAECRQRLMDRSFAATSTADEAAIARADAALGKEQGNG